MKFSLMIVVVTRMFINRIETVMQCDKILVMGAGRVLEFGSPSELLQNEEGEFARIAAAANSTAQNVN